MTIICIAIDDEPLALELLQDYIQKVPFLNLVRCFDDPLEALSYMRENTIDLIFLDIQMDGISGIQFVQLLKNKPQIIFITAYDKYAVQGYELDIVDYLLKPISLDRFIKAVEKAYERLQSCNGSCLIPHSDNHGIKEDFFFVKTEFKHTKVNFDEVQYIEGMGDYQCIFTDKGKIMTLQTFRKFEEILPLERFVRIHKSYIIPFGRISTIEKNKVKIGEREIPIGDSYKLNFLDVLRKKQII